MEVGDMYKVETVDCVIVIEDILGQRVYFSEVESKSKLKDKVTYYKIREIEESDSIKPHRR